jgi:hypothetical protein
MYQTGYGWNVAIRENNIVFGAKCIDVQDGLTWSQANRLKNRLQENLDLFRSYEGEEVVRNRFELLDIRK